jgi:hypothetical protein
MVKFEPQFNNAIDCVEQTEYCPTIQTLDKLDFLQSNGYQLTVNFIYLFHIPVLSKQQNAINTLDYRVCHNSSTTGAICGAGTSYPSGAREFTPALQWGYCCLSIFSFLCSMLYIIVCPFYFVHCIVLSFDLRLLLNLLVSLDFS